MKISGFTIVRNANLLNYPFRESVESLLPVCDEFIINCGESTDGTKEICEELARAYHPKIKILFRRWDSEPKAGGLELSHQTNEAIEACQGQYCFYIQADEVFHERGIPSLNDAISKLDNLPSVEGLVFDYRHFYVSYEYTIEGRKWYRREVRLFKNGRGITSFRDAQGFRKAGGEKLRVIPANAEIFHYGYVRDEKSLHEKEKQMSKFYSNGSGTPTPELGSPRFKPVRHIGIRKFQGTHPKVMREKIQNSSSHFNPKDWPRRWDKREIKDLLTVVWESLIPIRIGEFKNYEEHEEIPGE